MTYTFTVGKFYNRNFLNVADRKLDGFLCVERYKNQIKTIIKKPYSQKKMLHNKQVQCQNFCSLIFPCHASISELVFPALFCSIFFLVL